VEIFIENFDKVVNGFKVGEVIVSDVDADTEVQSGVTTVDDLEVTELHKQRKTLGWLLDGPLNTL